MASSLLVGFSAFLLYFAYPPTSFWPVAFGSLIPLLQTIEGARSRAAFKLGFFWGLVFFGLLIWWLIPTISTYGKINFILATPVVLCLCCYLALYPALWTLWVKKLFDSGLSGLSLVLAATSAWVVLEFLRSHLFSGFPWGLMAYSLTAEPLLIQTADIWSVYGVGFVVVFFNLSVFEASRILKGKGEFHQKRIRLALQGCTLCVLLSFFCLYGVLKIGGQKGTTGVDAAAVQAAIDQNQKWNPAITMFTVDTYIDLTSRAKKLHPALTLAIWPETAMPFYFQEESVAKKRLKDFVRANGLFLLFGSPSYTYDKQGRVQYLNSAYFMGPDGQVFGRYDKQHLVPFGEYMPLGPITSWARRFLPTAGDFISGTSSSPLKGGPFKIGTMICFESIFPEIARKEVAQGANLLAVITNDAWFGNTPAPWQHADMAIFRAVETRRWLVRAANTGVSRIISPSGNVLANTDLFRPEFVVSKVYLGENKTFFVQFGTKWFIAMNLLVIMLFLYKIKRKGNKEAI